MSNVTIDQAIQYQESPMQTINFPVILIFAFMVTAVADDLSAQNNRKSKKRAVEKAREVQAENTLIKSIMGRLDKNDDLKISRDEAPEAMLERFDRMDGNDDGVIDAKEIRLAVRRQRAGAPNNGNNNKKQMKTRNDSRQDGKKKDGKESGKKKRRGKAADRDGSMEESGEMNESAKSANRSSAKTDRMNPAALLRRLDKNKDQQVSKDEVPKRMQAAWDRIDTNKNMVLDPDEVQMVQRFMSRNKDKPNNNQQRQGSSRGGVVPKRPGS